MSKERLTIDEIIEHCKRRVSWYERIRSREFLEDENNSIKAAGMEEYWKHRQVAEYLEELKQYRDLEEQGLLLRLPCERVWFICDKGSKYATVMSKSIYDLEVYQIKEIDVKGHYFSTEEKAEEKLRELEGK